MEKKSNQSPTHEVNKRKYTREEEIVTTPAPTEVISSEMPNIKFHYHTLTYYSMKLSISISSHTRREYGDI